MKLGRREFIATGLAAGMMAPYALAEVKKSASGARKMALVNGEDEEEMYKEMYLALMANEPIDSGEIVDDVSTTLSRAYAFQGITSFAKATFNKCTKLASNCFRAGNNTVYEINLPEVTSCTSFQFYGNVNVKVIRIPKCSSLGSSSLQGTNSLTDIYITDFNKAETIGFPWGSTNADTVFHFKDGDYDYQGNPINA